MKLQKENLSIKKSQMIKVWLKILIWSGNKGYSKLLIVKVDKQLITKIIITYFSKILNRFKEF